MKILFLTLTVLLTSFAAFSQSDSKIIHSKYLEDKDLLNLCELADIQIQKIYSDDTLLRGKVFNVIIKEFKKGKIHSNYNLHISSKKQRFPFVMNGDTVYYELDFTDKSGFGKNTKSVTLTFS